MKQIEIYGIMLIHKFKKNVDILRRDLNVKNNI